MRMNILTIGGGVLLRIQRKEARHCSDLVSERLPGRRSEALRGGDPRG